MLDLRTVTEQYFWVDLVAGAATALAAGALVARRPGPLHDVLASRPLRGAGAFSYSIYCVHLPILWLVWHFGIDRVTDGPMTVFTGLTLVGVPAVLVGSYWFSRAFERPFLTHRSFRSLFAALRRSRVHA